MPTLTATVKFVNPPKAGKKRGTIKLQDDSMIGLWPNQMGLFQPGKAYEIEYETSDFNGQQYRNVKSAKEVSAPGGSAGAAGGGNFRPTAPQDAKRMWMCAILVAYIRAGKLDLNRQSLRDVMTMLSEVYADIGGQQHDPEMNDEIPF